MTYANGRAPESALVRVDGLHTVPSIAPRVNAFIAYAKTQGRTLRLAHPYGSYRDLTEQAAIGKSASGIAIAALGYSTHGNYDLGRVDFVGANGYTYTSAELTWIVANAGRFGLVREFGTADPNHFMASGSFASVGGEKLITNGEHEVTVYADGGPGPKLNPNPSSFWIGSPGSWVHVDNSKISPDLPTVVAILAQAFNQPITMFINDLTAVGNVWLSLGSASSGGAANLQPVLDQLAAIEKLETTDQSALIAAIDGLPAAVRKAIVAAP